MNKKILAFVRSIDPKNSIVTIFESIIIKKNITNLQMLYFSFYKKVLIKKNTLSKRW